MFNFERGKSSLVNEEGFFKKVIDNRYQDTPYSIIKENDHSWSLYIISEDLNTIYGGWGYYTKKSAIKAIENKEFYNEMKREFKLHFEALDIIQKYMISKIEENENSTSSTR